MSAKGSPAPSVTRDAIAQRAFELYVARGSNDGDADSDWFRAEQELSASAP